MEEDLIARLLADSGLAALVANEINWIDRPQGDALPSVTLQIITSGRSYNFKGVNGLAGTRVQMDCWGGTYAAAKAVSRAVTTAIEPPVTHGGTVFGASFLDNAPDFPPEDLAGGVTAFRVKMDWIIWHRPA